LKLSRLLLVVAMDAVEQPKKPGVRKKAG